MKLTSKLIHPDLAVIKTIEALPKQKSYQQIKTTIPDSAGNQKSSIHHDGYCLFFYINGSGSQYDTIMKPTSGNSYV